jgi:hypothetical protein
MADTADRAKDIEEESRDREARRIDAAIEGARDMRAWTGPVREQEDERTVTGGGRYAVGGSPSGGRGAGLTSAEPGEQDSSPAAETGGPRGAGTSISSTSGGLDPRTGREIDRDQWIKEQTSIRPKKPLPKP